MRSFSLKNRTQMLSYYKLLNISKGKPEKDKHKMSRYFSVNKICNRMNSIVEINFFY